MPRPYRQHTEFDRFWLGRKTTRVAPSRAVRWNEENTVDHPILDWLQTPELGWRFENQAKYRTWDGALRDAWKQVPPWAL